MYVYDLAMGMAKNFSGFVGFQLEGIWHTAVVCFGREWFFGGGGIESCHPGGTVLGQPLKVLDQGETGLDSAAFLDYLRGLKEGRFRGDRYSLLDHNCNNFSNEVSTFLTGKGLPGYILELPEKVKRSPVAAVLTPLIEQATPRGENVGENFQVGSALGKIRLSTTLNTIPHLNLPLPPKKAATSQRLPALSPSEVRDVRQGHRRTEVQGQGAGARHEAFGWPLGDRRRSAGG